MTLIKIQTFFCSKNSKQLLTTINTSSLIWVSTKQSRLLKTLFDLVCYFNLFWVLILFFELIFKLKGPKNENVRFKLEKKSDELYSLEFKPNLIGKYRVDIENFNKPILNSPCFVDAFDPNQVVITKPSDSFLVGTENFIDGLNSCIVFLIYRILIFSFSNG